MKQAYVIRLTKSNGAIITCDSIVQARELQVQYNITHTSYIAKKYAVSHEFNLDRFLGLLAKAVILLTIVCLCLFKL